MKVSLKVYVILQLCSLMILSCSNIKTEEDKHPDMPFFPKHTNSEIEITSLGYHIDSLYKNSDNTFITYGSNNHSISVLEMDNNFNIRDSINTYGLFETLEDGSFYVNGKGRYKALKYNEITAKPIGIEEHPFDGSQYQENQATKIYNEYYDRGFPDSLFYTISDKVDSISFKIAAREFKKQVFEGLQCVVKTKYMNPIYVYKDKEYVHSTYPDRGSSDFRFWEDAPKVLMSKVADCKSMKSVQTVTDKNFTLFEKAVTGSGSRGGNHFVPGSFYPKGLQYFNMEIEGVTTSFKVYAPYLSSVNISTRRIVNTNIFIIDIINGDNKHFQPKHSYIARLKK